MLDFIDLVSLNKINYFYLKLCVKNVISSLINSYQAIDRLKQLLTSLKERNEKSVSGSEIEPVTNVLKHNLEFIYKRKSVRLIRQKLSKREKFRKRSTSNFYQVKIEEFFKQESLFGGRDLLEQNQQVLKRTEPDKNLEDINNKLFDLKQLKEYLVALEKYSKVKIVQQQKNNSSHLESKLNDLKNTIDTRKANYERTKSELEGDLY